MVPVPRALRVLMWIVIGVSIPEGLALALGPESWYTSIWGWALTPMTARFTAGVYLSVAFGFLLGMRVDDWERLRIPLAMLWSFALIALLAAVVAIALPPASGSPVRLERPFMWVWLSLYAVSVAGGMYFQIWYPRKFGAKAW